MRRTTERLFDHLVGARKYGRGNVEAKRLRGFQIEHQLIPGRCTGIALTVEAAGPRTET